MSIDLMHELDRGLRQLAQFQSVLDAAGLPAGIEATVSESIAIRYLQERPVSQHDLGEHLGLEKSTVSRLVDALIAKGWVTRSPSPDSKRVRLVELTSVGTRVAAQIERAMLNTHRGMIERLTEAEREALAVALPALVRAMAHVSH